MKKIHFKKITKADLKAGVNKLKNLKWEDVKTGIKERRTRREARIEARKNSERRKKIQPVLDWMNRLSLFMHALLAVGINFIIEVISRHSLFEAWDYMVGSPLVFLYNAFMIFATLSVVYLFRRRVFSRLIISVLWLVLGITNGIMLAKRVTPFNAQDLKVLKDALTLTTNYFSTFEIVLIAVGVIAGVIALIFIFLECGKYEGKMHRILAIGLVLICALGYKVSTTSAIENRVVSTYFGNIAFAYEDYGLPYCFMASLFNTGIDQPNGYSEEEILAITDDGAMTQTTLDKGVDEDELPNIIVVQLESFFDVDEVEFFETSEDALPNLHKLFSEYSSGYFKVPSVGAGTANTEFEVVTGMNMRYFGPGEYPYKTVLKNQCCESAATALASLGYGTHALHNNGGNFYSRAKVYDHLGFDSYTSKEFMNILQLTENGWAKDCILPEHIEDALDSTEGQDYIFTISLQGHGDYPEEQVIEDPKIKVEGIEDEALKNKWEYYVNQVYEMDQFAGDLISMVEERGEPTVVVFYGDHLPTLGLEASDLKSRYLYNTNYVIWDNIGLEKEDKNLPAYQLMATVFERIGIHAGTVFNYHQERHQSTDYLSDLELLQYDILYGEQYAYQGDAPITEGHMVMGLRDVTLEKIVPYLDTGYSIIGENMTRSSRVYVNGERVSSVFLNNTRIVLKDMELKDGDTIQIVQMGSSNTVFRKSNEYLYKNEQLIELKNTGTDLTKSWQDQED